jgi:hypothetical protein
MIVTADLNGTLTTGSPILAIANWAGLLLLSTGTVPFPALPPANGWSAQVIPFLLGMGALDGAAAGLDVFAAISLFIKNSFDSRLWMISLGIALTSAIIFTVGTLASGAWNDHSLAYVLLVIFFSPLFPLLYKILRIIGNKDKSSS